MKRRNFLKGILGAGVIAAVPALVEKPFITKYTHASYPLHEGIIDMAGFGLAPIKAEGARVDYDGKQGSEAGLLQEGINMLADIEHV